jgi:hypothetical protein
MDELNKSINRVNRLDGCSAWMIGRMVGWIEDGLGALIRWIYWMYGLDALTGWMDLVRLLNGQN